MKDWAFYWSRAFLVNVAIAISILFGIFYIAFNMLDSYTGHNDYVEIPDFKGKTVKQLEELTTSSGLTFFIVDSVFDSKSKKGTIIKQSPAAGEKVKEGRTVYVTINAKAGQKIKMPALLHKSFRLAQALLISRGLVLGDVIYEPDIAKNAVLKVIINGRLVSDGQEITKGSRVDLVLGSGESGETTSIPMLVGQTLQQAEENLGLLGLKLGYVKYNPEVKDQSAAVVVQQLPEFETEKQIKLGSSIDLVLGLP